MIIASSPLQLQAHGHALSKEEKETQHDFFFLDNLIDLLHSLPQGGLAMSWLNKTK